ncbi:MAG: hypothetical protein P8J20_18560 [Novosphingobium sp.]|nr:hypothetical protein [Novosphingobium sp.]
MALVRLAQLPDEPLAAAAQFHASELPGIRRALDNRPDQLTLVFAPADHSHHAWRLAAVQELAREYAPLRVNAAVSDEDDAIAAAATYLSEAKGLTGQLLALDGNGAGPVL